MSGEDNDPPSHGGNDSGHGGQGQPEGGSGQPPGGQPQGGQPQGGQPQGGQPQGGQAPPQGGQAPPQGGQPQGGRPQGGQAPPQGGQYAGQQGYGGPSAADQLTNAITSPVGKGYLILTALLTLTISIATIIVMSLTSFLGGSNVVGPLVLTSVGAGGSAGVISLGLGGGVLLAMTLATLGGAFLAQTLDEDAVGVAAVAGVCAFVGALVLGIFVGMGIVLNLPSGANAPEAGDAFVGAILLAIGALMAGAGGGFLADRFDPHDQSGGYQQGPPGGQQPPQGGQGPR